MESLKKVDLKNVKLVNLYYNGELINVVGKEAFMKRDYILDHYAFESHKNEDILNAYISSSYELQMEDEIMILIKIKEKIGNMFKDLHTYDQQITLFFKPLVRETITKKRNQSYPIDGRPHVYAGTNLVTVGLLDNIIFDPCVYILVNEADEVIKIDKPEAGTRVIDIQYLGSKGFYYIYTEKLVINNVCE